MGFLFLADIKQADNSFHWPQAVPWIFTAISLCLNFYQWLRSRKHLVKATVGNQRGEGTQAHKRYLTVTLTSYGADLYDVSVTFEWKKDGKVQSSALGVLGELPNPFKLLQSRRFFTYNDNPHVSVGVDALPAKDMSIVVRSGVLEVKRITGKRFKEQVIELTKIDMSMPPKPTAQAFRMQQSTWHDPPMG